MLTVALLVLSLPARAQEVEPTPTPGPLVIPPIAVGPEAEAAAREQLAPIVATSRYGMVASGSPAASSVGARILEEGGNAVDAAVAVAFALGVADPGQSGLGGQTFLLIRFADGRATAIDGSAAAPLRPKREELRQLALRRQTNGYPLVATPGTLAALALANWKYGSLPLAELIAPSIELAVGGSRMTPFARAELENYITRVRGSEYLSGLYLGASKRLWDQSHVFCPFDLGRTLWRIATHGWTDFYSGGIAREIARDMKENGGSLQWGDLDQMKAVEREPVFGRYRDLQVISFPPPCAGAAVIEALQIIDQFPAAKLRAGTVESAQVMLEAQRIAAIDENTILSLQSSQISSVTSRERAAQRAAQLHPDRALTLEEISTSTTAYWRDHDTTHVAVVDRFGNAVSVTQSLGRGFGACEATPGLGFPYNAILESFDYDNSGSRYYLFPLRRLFTAIAPTILVRDGRPFLVLGSAGSARIMPAIVNATVNVVDRGLPLGEALAAPRVLWGGGSSLIELAPPITAEIVTKLDERKFGPIGLTTFPALPWDLTNSGAVNAVLVQPDGTMVGGCDPRRGGAPVGGREKPAPGDLAAPWISVWNDLFQQPEVKKSPARTPRQDRPHE